MKLATILALGVAVLAPLGSAFAADDTLKVEKPIRVLAGIFNATSGTNKSRTSLGVGYDFTKSAATNPSVYGVYLDYNGKKTAGVTTSLTGVGVSGRFYLESANAAGKPYALVGLGSYTLKSGASQSKLGGKLGIGYELNNGWLGEIDYTTVQKIGGVDAGGTNIRLGYRF
jgi:Outer membrane protein beta-barrel domain